MGEENVPIATKYGFPLCNFIAKKRGFLSGGNMSSFFGGGGEGKGIFYLQRHMRRL